MEYELEKLWDVYCEQMIEQRDVLMEARRAPSIYPRLDHTKYKYDFATTQSSFADLEDAFYKSLTDQGITLDVDSQEVLSNEVFLAEADKEDIIDLYGESKYKAMLKRPKYKVFPLYEANVTATTDQGETIDVNLIYYEITNWFAEQYEEDGNEFKPLVLTYTLNEDLEDLEEISDYSVDRIGARRKTRDIDYSMDM